MGPEEARRHEEVIGVLLMAWLVMIAIWTVFVLNGLRLPLLPS
jgi:hypothetical protein